jgi:hypothetical protein
MHKYQVNVDVGFRPDEHGPAIPAGTEFQSDETPQIAEAVKRGFLVVVKKRVSASDDAPALEELTAPPPVTTDPVHGEAAGVDLAGVTADVEQAAPPAPKKTRRSKKK